MRYLYKRFKSLRQGETENQMQNSYDSLETRFDDFVQATNKRIEELEAMIVKLQMELNKTNSSTIKKDTVSIPNLEMRGSLGATVKTIGDIVG